jgi:hypothetical protein
MRIRYVLTQISFFKFSVTVCSQLARKIEALNNRADQLVLAADIIRSQIPHRNQNWIASMVDRDISRDVANVVLDVQHVERTGHRRDNTWQGLVIRSHNVVLAIRWAIKSEVQALRPSFIELYIYHLPVTRILLLHSYIAYIFLMRTEVLLFCTFDI